VLYACAGKLAMGICTRRRDVLYETVKAFPPEIKSIYLLWVGPRDTVGFDKRFYVDYAVMESFKGAK
jgi:hypothetical protein